MKEKKDETPMKRVRNRKNNFAYLIYYKGNPYPSVTIVAEVANVNPRSLLLNIEKEYKQTQKTILNVNFKHKDFVVHVFTKQNKNK